MSMLMLSVSGCRGVVGETLTPQVAARFAGCFAAELRALAHGKPVRVVLGRDGRKGCEMVHSAAVAGLLAAGCGVIDLGVATTPTVAVNTDAHALANAVSAGMVITASHNPQEWNGLKCLLREPPGLHQAGACAPPKAIADAIIARFCAGQEPSAAVGWQDIGSYERREEAAKDVHIARVHSALSAIGLPGSGPLSALGKGVKLAVDCVNASSVRTAPEFLRSLGCEVVALNTEPTGLFPHPPEPTEANLSGAGGLREAVLRHGCHAGFALDPDADRVAILDAGGRYIGEEYTLALGAKAILSGSRSSQERPVLVTNLSTSRMLEDVGQEAGASVVRTPVGEANVVEAMKREGAIAGGEGNGGVIWPRSCYVRDTLAAMGLVVALMALRRKSVAELTAEIPAYAIEKRKVDLAGKEHAAGAVAKVAAHFREHRVDTRDGVWVGITAGALAGRAWVHVRPSNTEPILRLIAEAPTAQDSRRLLDEAARAIGATGA